MRRFLLTLLGHRVTQHVAGQHARPGGALDVRFGLKLLRDRRVPAALKLRALALGVVCTLILEFVEIPAELLLAMLLPVLGFAIDIAVDGLEAVGVTLLVASLVLPRLLPAALAQALRDEHMGLA